MKNLLKVLCAFGIVLFIYSCQENEQTVPNEQSIIDQIKETNGIKDMNALISNQVEMTNRLIENSGNLDYEQDLKLAIANEESDMVLRLSGFEDRTEFDFFFSQFNNQWNQITNEVQHLNSYDIEKKRQLAIEAYNQKFMIDVTNVNAAASGCVQRFSTCVGAARSTYESDLMQCALEAIFAPVDALFCVGDANLLYAANQQACMNAYDDCVASGNSN